MCEFRYRICRQRSGRGFTLLELLVVTVIIAILASMLLPALSQTKRAAQILKCTGNFHQFGLVFLSFADDNDGFFPPSPTTAGQNSPSMYRSGTRNIDFVDLLGPYVGEFEIFTCPLSAGGPPPDDPGNTNNLRFWPYWYFGDQPPVWGYEWQVTGTRSDPDLSYFQEYIYDWGGALGYILNHTLSSTDTFVYSGNPSFTLYTGARADDVLGANVLYVDGHASHQKLDDLIPLWGAKLGKY